MMLAGTTRPRRPRRADGSLPTDLCLDRQDPPWLKNLGATRYYMYPVHLSRAFIFATTLSSALYLLLMRFLFRQYGEVCRIAESCTSDTPLSSSEYQTFQELAACNDDYHPDAYACRLRLWLATMGCREVMKCPWDLASNLKFYLQKRRFVSAACRLAPAEEALLLHECKSRAMDSMMVTRQYYLELTSSLTNVQPVDVPLRYPPFKTQGECSFMYRYILRESCS